MRSGKRFYLFGRVYGARAKFPLSSSIVLPNTDHRHDWGSSICYEAARLRPDKIKAVIGAVVPVRDS